MDFTINRLLNGISIEIGDILSSKSTNDVVVMWHEEKGELIAKVIGQDIFFPIDEFLWSWRGKLVITGNVNYYDPKGRLDFQIEP